MAAKMATIVGDITGLQQHHLTAPLHYLVICDVIARAWGKKF